MIQSAILSTDLDLLPPDAFWVSNDRATFVRTPSAPGFFWANYMIVPHASPWCTATQLIEGFRQNLDCAHIAIAWDSDAEPSHMLVDDFVQMGFEIDHCRGLSYPQQEAEPHIEESANHIRSIESDDDWQRVVALQQQMLGKNTSATDRKLMSKRFQQFRSLASHGNGFWLGIFNDEQLVADLGLFVFNGIARFQQIETHPEFRRRGYCTRLVTAAIREARRCFGPIRIVLEAEADSNAISLYQKIGFEQKESLISVFKAPEKLI